MVKKQWKKGQVFLAAMMLAPGFQDSLAHIISGSASKETRQGSPLAPASDTPLVTPLAATLSGGGRPSLGSTPLSTGRTPVVVEICNGDVEMTDALNEITEVGVRTERIPLL